MYTLLHNVPAKRHKIHETTIYTEPRLSLIVLPNVSSCTIHRCELQVENFRLSYCTVQWQLIPNMQLSCIIQIDLAPVEGTTCSVATRPLACKARIRPRTEPPCSTAASKAALAGDCGL